MTDLLYSEIEEELRSSVRALLADRCPHQGVLARCETPEPYDRKLWQALARDVGAASLAVPEEAGGAGASVREVAVVLEELGRAAAPTPYLGSTVLAGTALLAPEPGDGAAELLAALASGERTATLAVPLSTAPGAPFPAAVRADGAGALTGTVTSVADTGTADVLLVPAVAGDGPGLYAVDTDAAALTVTPRTSLDLTRPLADVTLAGAAARRLAGPGDAPAALERALLTGAGLLASEQLGIAEWCLTTTVAYLGDRRQFGRPLGSFQALKHRLADLWLDVAGARAAARYAAATLAAGDPDAPVAVAVAASHCGELAVRAAEECVQLHGGIGMTWEHPAHLYLKRAKADQIALGTPDRHRAALAGLVDLPAPAA
ncbi:acyl-CoA dehydrogenase family protein [Streptomyces glaucosporus]|uniref:Acyl-CoA dehydrogenase family protein n=1 Tax=Streptomyces glaucosporus TaxID=284044 RepID=A0ABP5V466_9ACTN